MNSILRFHRAVRHFSRKSVVLGIVLVGGLATINATAQVLVTDVPLTTDNTVHFASQLAKTAEQYAKQIQQYALQIQQYQQLLFKVTSLGTSFSIVPNTMQQISDPSALIRADCGSGSGDGLTSSIVSNIASLAGQTISESQQAICSEIVTLKVDKYNKTIQALGSIEGYGSSLTKLTSLVSSANNIGSSNEATSLVSGYNSQLLTVNSHWNAAMQADDAAIKALQGQQANLAKRALNGGGAASILSQALPDVAFEAAVHSIQ